MPFITDPSAAPLPVEVEASNPTGDLTAWVYGVGQGVLLRAQVGTGDGVLPRPDAIRFYRHNRYGTRLVRSGDPASAPGGVAYCYDYEAALDEASTWTAAPVYNGQEGQPLSPVGLVVPGFPAGADWHVWIKSPSNPGLSLNLPMLSEATSMSRDGQATVTAVSQRQYPAVGVGVRTEQARTYTLRTRTLADRDQLLGVPEEGRRGLLDEPVLLWQIRGDAHIRDFYAVTLSDVESYPTGIESRPERNVRVSVQLVPSPATIDAATVIPGRSHADTYRLAATFDQARDLWPTHADVIRSGVA